MNSFRHVEAARDNAAGFKEVTRLFEKIVLQRASELGVSPHVANRLMQACQRVPRIGCPVFGG